MNKPMLKALLLALLLSGLIASTLLAEDDRPRPRKIQVENALRILGLTWKQGAHDYDSNKNGKFDFNEMRKVIADANKKKREHADHSDRRDDTDTDEAADTDEAGATDEHRGTDTAHPRDNFNGDKLRRLSPEELRRRFDANGDGELDREESSRLQTYRKMFADQVMRELFDGNDDGEIDDEEAVTARRTQNRLWDRIGQEIPELRLHLLGEFDFDGDQELDYVERAELCYWQDGMQKKLRRKYDRDDDGELNAAEIEHAREVTQEKWERLHAAQRLRNQLEQFDLDQDGVLSGEEKQAARDYLIDKRRTELEDDESDR